MSNEKRIMKRLRPYTHVVLFIHGENNWDSKKTLYQHIAAATATLAVAKAMLNDESPPPTTTTEPSDEAASQGELPWATDEHVEEQPVGDAPLR